jgi:hypothetical protein
MPRRSGRRRAAPGVLGQPFSNLRSPGLGTLDYIRVGPMNTGPISRLRAPSRIRRSIARDWVAAGRSRRWRRFGEHASLLLRGGPHLCREFQKPFRHRPLGRSECRFSLRSRCDRALDAAPGRLGRPGRSRYSAGRSGVRARYDAHSDRRADQAMVRRRDRQPGGSVEAEKSEGTVNPMNFSTRQIRVPSRSPSAFSHEDGRRLVRPAGLEPATPGLGNQCSVLLSYGREKC